MIKHAQPLKGLEKAKNNIIKPRKQQMERNEKLVIVINGKGGVGKDTLCESITSEYKILNVSAITPIKEIAQIYGWQGEKDEKARRFLSELKRAFTNYNDLPTRYLLEQYQAFLKSDDGIMFVHIREGEEIRKFVEAVAGKCVTLLIYNNTMNRQVYGNESDDCVEQYDYDYRFDNSAPLKQSKEAFLKYIGEIWEKERDRLI